MRSPVCIIALSLSILLGLQGCATRPPKPPLPRVPEYLRTETRAIEIVVSEELPRVAMELPSKGAGSGARRKADKWTGNWAKAAGIVAVSGRGDGAALGVAIGAAMLVVTPVVAAAGAVKGAIEASSADTVESQEAQVQVALQSGQLIRQLEDQLLTQLRDHTDHAAIPHSKKTDDQPSHREGTPTAVIPQWLLRVQLQSIELQGPFDVDPPLELHFTVHAALAKDSDATPQYTRSFQYVTGTRRLAEWTADDGKHFRETVNLSLARLAELIIDDLFLTYPFVHDHRGAKHGS